MPASSPPDHGSEEHRDPTQPADPLVPAGFGGWFRRVADASRRGLVRLVLVQFVAIVLVAGCTALFQPRRDALFTEQSTGMSSTVLGTINSLLLIAIMACAVTASAFIMIKRAAGQSSAAVRLVRFTIRRAWPLTFWLAVAGSGYLLLVWLTAIGGAAPPYFALAVFLYLYVVLGGSLIGVVVVERRLWPIGRCFSLIRRRFWRTTGRLLIAHLAVMLYFWVVSLLPSYPSRGLVGGLLGFIHLIPIGIVGTAVAVVSYAELRGHSDPSTTADTLADELTS